MFSVLPVKMVSLKVALVLALCCLAAAVGIDLVVSQSPLLDQLLEAFFAVEPLVAFINMARPVESFPEQTQNAEQAETDHTNDEIYKSSTQEILARSGYKSRTHYVISKDGYITEVIEVVNPLADQSQLKQPPVMIFHGGLIDTSAYLWGSAIQHHPEKYPRTEADGPITSSNRSLGFMLPNYGYRVWLVGTRGANRQNLNHTTLRVKYLEDILANPLDLEAPIEIVDTLKYFDYSQDELVENEFPAQIEKVLELSNSLKVSTITYSLSTHVMYKILASNKSLAEKIYTNVALAPLLNRNGANTFWRMCRSRCPNQWAICSSLRWSQARQSEICSVVCLATRSPTTCTPFCWAQVPDTRHSSRTPLWVTQFCPSHYRSSNTIVSR